MLKQIDNSKLFKLRKNIQVQSFGDTIVIGSLGVDWIEIENNTQNLKLLKVVIEVGVSLIDESSPRLMKKINEKNWFYNSAQFDNSMFDIQSRQFWYNRHMGVEVCNDNQLTQKKVLLLGAGGGGAMVGKFLSQLGIGEIIILDHDLVSYSDTLRVPIYNSSHVGKYKAEVLSKIICSKTTKSEYLKHKIETKSQIIKLIKTYKPDIIIKAIDPSFKIINYLNEACFDYEVPYYSCAYFNNTIKLGPLFIPGITSCFNSISDFNVSEFPNLLKDQDKHERMFDDILFHPSINFNISICASLAVKDIYFFLLGVHNNVKTINTIVTFDTISMNVAGFSYTCKDCKICGK